MKMIKIGNHTIYNMKVEDWAAEYTGPPFHALLADCPYHLTSIVKRFKTVSDLDRKVAKANPYRRTSSGFMGRSWDGLDENGIGIAFNPEMWEAIGNHLYPGAFGLAFSGARTWHRMAVAIEDAGFILHPSIFLWAYSQGFPKATRIDSQVDRDAGVERETIEVIPDRWTRSGNTYNFSTDRPQETLAKTAPATPLAKTWEGHRYGAQSLKPATEPIIMFQRPYDGRPIDNITGTGAGALWIDGGRIGTGNEQIGTRSTGGFTATRGIYNGDDKYEIQNADYDATGGRWPSNLILCHLPGCQIVGQKTVKGYEINRFTDGMKPFGHGEGHNYEGETIKDEIIDVWECIENCPVRLLDEQSGNRPGCKTPSTARDSNSIYRPDQKNYQQQGPIYPDDGGASRYFYQAQWFYEIQEQLENSDSVCYVAKASNAEKDAGLFDFYWNDKNERITRQEWERLPKDRRNQGNSHPTCKPIALTTYLAKLLLPPPEYAPRRIVIPFSGTSSEMVGAMLAGFEEVVGIEMTPEYCDMAEARLKYWETRKGMPIKVIAQKEKEAPAGQVNLFGLIGG